VALEDDDRAGIHDGPECNRCPSQQLADNSSRNTLDGIQSRRSDHLSRGNRGSGARLREVIVARKTVLVCDKCGAEVEEGKGAVMRATFPDAGRGARPAALCDPGAGSMPGTAVARRGRKPKSLA